MLHTSEHHRNGEDGTQRYEADGRPDEHGADGQWYHSNRVIAVYRKLRLLQDELSRTLVRYGEEWERDSSDGFIHTELALSNALRSAFDEDIEMIGKPVDDCSVNSRP